MEEEEVIRGKDGRPDRREWIKTSESKWGQRSGEENAALNVNKDDKV